MVLRCYCVHRSLCSTRVANSAALVPHMVSENSNPPHLSLCSTRVANSAALVHHKVSEKYNLPHFSLYSTRVANSAALVHHMFSEKSRTSSDPWLLCRRSTIALHCFLSPYINNINNNWRYRILFYFVVNN